MNKNTLIALGIFIALLLIGIFYKEGKSDEALRWNKLEAKSIDKIALKQEGKELILIKNSGRWEIGTHAYLADQDSVKDITDIFTEDRSFELISDHTNAYPQFGLGKEERISTEIYGKDKLLKKLAIGKVSSSYGHTYVIPGDSKEVYQTRGDFAADFKKNQDELRDKKILNFSKSDLISLEIVNAKGLKKIITQFETPPEVTQLTNITNQTTQKSPEKFWQDQDGNKLKKQKVDDIVNTLSSLSCSEFEKNTSEAMSKRKFKRQFMIKTLSDQKTLTIYAIKEEKAEATIAGRKTSFFLNSYTTENLMIDFKELQE